MPTLAAVARSAVLEAHHMARHGCREASAGARAMRAIPRRTIIVVCKHHVNFQYMCLVLTLLTRASTGLAITTQLWSLSSHGQGLRSSGRTVLRIIRVCGPRLLLLCSVRSRGWTRTRNSPKAMEMTTSIFLDTRAIAVQSRSTHTI